MIKPRVPTTGVHQVSQRDFESEKRLRKDLKRTKALLADAQIMLDHLKNNAPSKREIAQLKNQVSLLKRSCWFQGQGSLLLVFFPSCSSWVLESLGRKMTGMWEEVICSNQSAQGLCTLCSLTAKPWGGVGRAWCPPSLLWEVCLCIYYSMAVALDLK